MSRASRYELFDLRGRHVRTTRPLPLLPPGSTGEVVDICRTSDGAPGILVRWDKYNFEDTFGRDRSGDETGWLEVMDSPAAGRGCPGEAANVLTADKECTLVAPKTGR